jgi:hypothetical protein
MWLLLLSQRKTRSEVPLFQQWNYLHPWQVTKCVVSAHGSEQIAGNVYAVLFTYPLTSYRDTYVYTVSTMDKET